MKCTYGNCLTCPYDDCISAEGPVITEKRKPGRKKLPPEVKAQNNKRWQQDYYQKNKEIKKEYAHKYYAEHAKEIRQKEKEKRINKDASPHSIIWITDGKANKRVRLSTFTALYEKRGWTRGRTLTPYKYKEKVKEIV